MATKVVSKEGSVYWSKRGFAPALTRRLHQSVFVLWFISAPIVDRAEVRILVVLGQAA